MAVLLDGDAIAMTLALHLAVNNQLPAADVALHLAFTHYLNQMLFGLNVAGQLAVNIDMAAGDDIADEMYPAGDDRGLVFFCWRPLRVLGLLPEMWLLLTLEVPFYFS